MSSTFEADAYSNVKWDMDEGPIYTQRYQNVQTLTIIMSYDLLQRIKTVRNSQRKKNFFFFSFHANYLHVRKFRFKYLNGRQ